MEIAEDPLERELTLSVLLPGGTEETATIHGSKPVMDVLVTLCGEYHLNPSEHIIELVSTNQNHIKFKPNSLIGSLEADRVVLKQKGEEDKTRRRCPYMPEVSVRLLILYRRSHRAVVRVSPKVPLSELLPAICDKCEFDPDTTLLFLNSQSDEPVDLSKSLNDLGIREVFAKNTKVIPPPELVITPKSGDCEEDQTISAKDKSDKGKENKGFLSLLRKVRKKPQKGVSTSAPASPLHQKQRTISLSFFTSRCSTLPSEKSKKRRAPLPPLLASQSYPTHLNVSQSGLSTQHATKEPTAHVASPTELSLKRTKRRAPPPPPAPPSPPRSASPDHMPDNPCPEGLEPSAVEA